MDQSDGDINWQKLLTRIKEGRSTPFVGAGACVGILPLGNDLAVHFAKKWGYPTEASEDKAALDLARVAQFQAVIDKDFLWPKEEMRRLFDSLARNEDEVGADGAHRNLRGIFKVSGVPDPDDEYQLHRVLAELPFPLYITTNYDNLLVEALRSPKLSIRKSPQMRFCPWNDACSKEQGALKGEDEIEFDVDHPLVYHLHGHVSVDTSMVLTEDDYVDFLMRMGEDQNLVHHLIQRAITSTSLLFVGYRLGDWDFRVLFRQLFTSLQLSTQSSHVSVQIPKVRSDEANSRRDASSEKYHQQQRIQDYLRQSLNRNGIQIYWGSGAEFARQLREQWKDFPHGA